jgi:hypothetical protein
VRALQRTRTRIPVAGALAPRAEHQQQTTEYEQRTRVREHAMSLSHRQQHKLSDIESRLLRSDPPLAEKLKVFGKLSAGQRMPTWEHVDTRRDRIRQAAALIAQAVAVITATISLLVKAVLTLVIAIVIGGRARPPQRARQQVRPGTDGRPGPVSGR